MGRPLCIEPMRPRNTKKLISGALLAVVLGSLWFYLAPTSVGGSTSWVVTDGISMEPRFHAGDLVIVRAQSHYRVGEIVAYRNRQLHTVVLHRIVGRDGSRYIFKGDNNNFLDFEHPAQSQLIGALWLHLPGVGSRLESLHSPTLIGCMFALATLLFAGAAFTDRRRRRRRRDRRADGNTGATAGSRQAAGRLCRLPSSPAASCAAPVRLPGATGVHTPLPGAPAKRSAIRAARDFSYTARAKPGPSTPGDLARTGDPLFTHVVNRVRSARQYRFDSRPDTSTERTDRDDGDAAVGSRLDPLGAAGGDKLRGR